MRHAGLRVHVAVLRSGYYFNIKGRQRGPGHRDRSLFIFSLRSSLNRSVCLLFLGRCRGSGFVSCCRNRILSSGCACGKVGLDGGLFGTEPELAILHQDRDQQYQQDCQRHQESAWLLAGLPLRDHRSGGGFEHCLF